MAITDFINFFTKRSSYNINWKSALLISWLLFVFLVGLNHLTAITVGNLIFRVFTILDVTSFIVICFCILSPIFEEYFKLVVYRKLNFKSGLLIACFINLLEALHHSIRPTYFTVYMFIPSRIDWFVLVQNMTFALHILFFFVAVYCNYSNLGLIITSVMHGVYNVVSYASELNLPILLVGWIPYVLYLTCSLTAISLCFNKKYKFI